MWVKYWCLKCRMWVDKQICPYCGCDCVYYPHDEYKDTFFEDENEDEE